MRNRLRFVYLALACVLPTLSGCGNVASQLEVPVRVKLDTYIIPREPFVAIDNFHETQILQGVKITYTDVSGHTRTQQVGVIRPKERKRISPSDVKWKVERNEKITISADGYLDKSIDVNLLLD